MGNTWENLPHLKKYGTVDEMEQPWKNAPNLENALHLENCATLREMHYTCKNVRHLEKWVTPEKLRHSW